MNTAISVDSLKRGWMFVGAAFQEGHDACETCRFADFTREPRPYGMGTAYENMSECTLGQRASDALTMCPAYQQHLAEDHAC